MESNGWHRLLSRISDDVDKQLRRSAFDRFLHRASIANMLDDHIDALDSAWRTFDASNSRERKYWVFVLITILDCLSDGTSCEDGKTGNVRRPFSGRRDLCVIGFPSTYFETSPSFDCSDGVICAA